MKHPSRNRAVAYVVSTVAFLVVMAASGAPSVLLAAYQRQWHFPDAALTVAFAIYALALVVALLFCGSLSDHIGRRPVAVGSLLLTALSMVLFLCAGDVTVLILARGVQGVATGLATVAFSAWITELASPRRRKQAETLVAVSTAGGLGVGVVVAGAVSQFAAHPEALIFGTSLVAVLVAAALLLIAPESVAPRGGIAASLLPRLTLERHVAKRMARLAPAVVGIWMSAGLILGLGASLSRAALHLGDGFLAAVVVATQPLTATVCSLLLAPRLRPRPLLALGSSAVLVGVAAEGCAFVTGVAVLEIVGAFITGLGFGAVLTAVLVDMVPRVDVNDRGAFFAVFYLVGYLPYGCSAIAAGLLSDTIGLARAAAVYAAAIIVVILLALVLNPMKSSRTRADAQASRAHRGIEST
ncbi:MFS transporter [Leifsonia sp. AG29]|uniref:MFS transporter n=1 Tax=Leifsonia sp. AG29 TaxID=2598860 RepID=UPI00131C09D7|nr:MFS transporter [Leifsonia sp. AG29]